MDDLISRQAAIDELAKFVPYAICDESTESYTNGLKDAYNLICQLPSAQRWIPCSEMLPEAKYGESDTVLCCTELGLMYILYWNGGNWCVPTGEPHQWVNHKTGWHDKVIAWMPLPEPYRAEREDE